MKIVMRIIKAEKFTVGDARRIKDAIEKAGYQVELEPTEIDVVQYTITKETPAE